MKKATLPIPLLFALSSIMGSVAHAQTLSTLYSFCSQANCQDGEVPLAPLAQGTDGNFYGTTEQGGENDFGTVFKITPSGNLATLYRFTGSTDGGYPDGALTLTTGSEFYGTTSDDGDVRGGAGTAFKITPAGKLTTLVAFGPGGWAPEDGLLHATDGNFYGTTAWGGLYGSGTVFRMTANGVLTYIYNFCSLQGCADGIEPVAALVQGTDGNLYGTTAVGGTNNSCNQVSGGCGTVFKITPEGSFTTLYSFCSQTNCSDGAIPYDSLVQAADGSLYGTTGFGGTGSVCPNQGPPGCGTVFRITPTGKFTTLHSFCVKAACGDGAFPHAGLALGTDGNLYGTTYSGVVNIPSEYGTIFRIAPSGTFRTLYTFCSQPNCADGGEPVANLLQATNGSFYGTTPYGGSNGGGTLFSLSVGLGAFVQTVPTSGKVGSKVVILGNGLTGTTSVTFNGTSTTFAVNSTGTAITATVPGGATSGFVEVTTPSGTLTSNVKFRVP